MGRALVIITTGMVFIFGIIQMSIQSRHMNSTEINIESANEIQARNFAYSGIEMAVMNLNDGFWELNENYTYHIDNSVVEIEIEEITPGEIFVRSTGLVNNRMATVLAHIQSGGSGGMPPVNAAISILGDNFEIRASSAAWRIDGRNTRIGSTSGGSAGGDHLPGIIATPSAYASILSSTSRPNRQGQIQGKAGIGTPNMVSEIPDPDYVKSISDFTEAAIKSSAAVSFGSGVNSTKTLGTESNPQITVIDGDAKFTGGVTGTGVIIVKEGSRLDVGGNFKFNGLIIIEGTIKASGTPHIWGGLIYTEKHDYGNGSYSMVNNGTPKFYYSKDALDLVQSRVGTLLGSGYTITGIYH